MRFFWYQYCYGLIKKRACHSFSSFLNTCFFRTDDFMFFSRTGFFKPENVAAVVNDKSALLEQVAGDNPGNTVWLSDNIFDLASDNINIGVA